MFIGLLARCELIPDFGNFVTGYIGVYDETGEIRQTMDNYPYPDQTRFVHEVLKFIKSTVSEYGWFKLTIDPRGITAEGDDGKDVIIVEEN